MSWKDKLAEANARFQQAKDIIADPEATAEQKSHVPEILEEGRKLKEQALQYKDLLETAQAELAKMNEVSNQTHPLQAGPSQFKDWGEYLSAVYASSTQNVKDDRLVWIGEKKSMSGAVGSEGGFLIAPQFLPQLMAVQAEESIIRSAGASIIRITSGREVHIPVLDQTMTDPGQPHWFGGMQFYWAEEGEEKTETQPSFRQIKLVAKKLIGLTNASDELLDDSAISLGDFLTGPLGFAGGIAWMEDFAFLRGPGGGQPRGLVDSPVTLSVARQAAGRIGYIDVINMVQSFMPSGRGRWFISHSALAEIVQMTGPAGNPSYVWQPNAREGIPGYLLGMPVTWTEKNSLMGQRGDIVLADCRYYLIGDRQSTTIDTTKFHRWVYDETSWRVVHRVDGQPWLSAPITYQDGTTQVSPFVVLDQLGS